MKRRDFQPSPLAPIQVRREGGRFTLQFVRELPHPPEAVWAALTDPAQLREWAPFESDRDLGVTGSATLSMVAGPDQPAEASPTEVRISEPPKLLEYLWGEDVLRWELEPIASGTRMTLLHTMSDPAWLSKVSAGWHLCFDVAARYLAGAPIGRIVADDAKNYGWEELNRAYAEVLPPE